MTAIKIEQNIENAHKKLKAMTDFKKQLQCIHKSIPFLLCYYDNNALVSKTLTQNTKLNNVK